MINALSPNVADNVVFIMRRESLPYALVAGQHRPHAFGSGERSLADGLFDSHRLDMAVMEQVIEPFAVESVLVVAECSPSRSSH